MQIVVHLFFDEIPHKLIDTHATKCKRITIFIFIGGHCQRSQFDFGLRFKHWFHHSHSDCCHKSVAHILHFVVFTEILFDGARYVFLESTLVRTTLRGVLTIDEGIILLAILSRVGESNVDALAFQMHDGI